MDSRRSSRNGLGVGAAAIGQIALLAWIAGLGASGVAAAIAIGAIGAAALGPAALRRAPDAAVMLAVGGLGMTAGWWADLGTTTAAHAREPLDLVWCHSPAALVGVGHALSWMNLGMLAFGLPAVAATRRGSGREGAHGIAGMVACAAGMSAGMNAGSRCAAALAPALGAQGSVVADWTLMSVGMVAGMAAVERVLRWMARISRRAASAAMGRRTTPSSS